MTDQSPTTMNGPLHTPEANIDDRLMRASYASASDAEAARNLLIQNGIAADRISLVQNAADSAGVQAALQPKDTGVIAKVRDALLPDDSNMATAKAAKNSDAILEIRPTKEEVEMAVRIIESSNPSHFDASLERWRNAG